MGHHVHELCLGFRFPSLRLEPVSEGRYDYIALVPLDLRPPERHAPESTTKRSWHSASHTGAPAGLLPAERLIISRGGGQPTSAALTKGSPRGPRSASGLGLTCDRLLVLQGVDDVLTAPP